MRPGEEVPLEVLVSGTRPPYGRYVPEDVMAGQENEDALQDGRESGLQSSSDPKNFEEMKRDEPECEQNGNGTGCSDTLAATRQSDGDARPVWQQIVLFAKPEKIREIARRRAIVDTRLHEAQSLDAVHFERAIRRIRSPVRSCPSLPNYLNNNNTVRRRAMVDTRLHEALDAEDFEEAIRSAVRAGASLAAFDEAGQTVLHQCIKRRILGPFKVLLSYNGSANLEDAAGFPLLNVAILHKWADGARALLAAGASVTAVSTGFTRNIWKNSDRFWADDWIQMMQNFIHSRYPSVDSSFSTLFYKRTPAVHLTVEVDELGLLKEILDERQEIVDCLNGYGETALYTAVVKNNMPAVKILLMRGASLNVNHDLNDLMVNNAMTALHLAAQHASNQAAHVILEHDSSTVNELDDDGNTALAIAANNGNKELMLMLLKKGAVLSTKSEMTKTAIELITCRFLDCSSFFELVFDEFIYTDEHDNIIVDYGCLTHIRGMNQINVIEEFVRCGQSKILLHPLIKSLLYLKWRHLLPVFCLIIGVYSVFLITFNIFVVHAFYYRDICIRNLTSVGIKTESGKKEQFEMNAMYWLLITLIYGSLCTILVLELYCIYLKRLRYFGHMESWVKVCMLVLSAVVPCAITVAEPADWLRHAACAALLLGWLQAMFLLARFPYWGNNVLMFGTAAINLVKVLVTAIFLVIAFSFCFMIQYQSTRPFDGPFPAFVKTIVMMCSEFDYDDLFGTSHDNELQARRTVVVRLLFVLFVIFVAIVLMNFMIGAAVSDIKDLIVTGNIKMLEKQVQLLSILDNLVHDGGKLEKMIRKIFDYTEYHDKIVTSSGIELYWFVDCATSFPQIFRLHSNTYLMYLHMAFLDIVTKKKEVQECKCNSSKIEQLTSELAILKQMTSDIAANMKK